MSDLIKLGGRQRYSEETGAEIVRLLEQGKSTREIARVLGQGQTTIAYWIRRHHLEARVAAPARSRKPQLDVLMEALELGLTREAAAAKAGYAGGELDAALNQSQELERQVTDAERRCQERYLEVIQEHAAKNWLPAAWLLERRFGFVKGESSAPERAKVSRAIGTQLARAVAQGLGGIGLSADQQEELRQRLGAELEKALRAV